MNEDEGTPDFGQRRHLIAGVDDFLSEDDALKLADTISVIQAACCIVGVSPSIVSYGSSCLHFRLKTGNPIKDKLLPTNQVGDVINAICNAITSMNLKPAHIRRPDDVDDANETDYNIWETLIEVEELKRWLLSRNCKPPFFFGSVDQRIPDYLDEMHPHYSAQIGAAIQVWEALQDPELRKGKSVKGAASDWLETHYRALGLVHQGKRSKNAIERISSLINWETGGGAPKTPE